MRMTVQTIHLKEDPENCFGMELRAEVSAGDIDDVGEERFAVMRRIIQGLQALLEQEEEQPSPVAVYGSLMSFLTEFGVLLDSDGVEVRDGKSKREVQN